MNADASCAAAFCRHGEAEEACGEPRGRRQGGARENTESRQRRRAANQEAGDKVEQGKNTEVRQSKRAANQEAGDKAEEGKKTEARLRKRVEIREGA